MQATALTWRWLHRIRFRGSARSHRETKAWWQVMRACVRGCQDEESIRANREGFSRFALRPRVLVDVSK